MHGAGPIGMLAREMTDDLQAQVAGLPDGSHTLTTKGVKFEIEIAQPQIEIFNSEWECPLLRHS